MITSDTKSISGKKKSITSDNHQLSFDDLFQSNLTNIIPFKEGQTNNIEQSFEDQNNSLVDEYPLDKSTPKEISQKVQKKVFDDQRDKDLISQGNHFYCKGHLTAVPITTQSENPNYCKQCLEVIKTENIKSK